MFPNFTRLWGEAAIFGEEIPAYFMLLMTGFAVSIWLAARQAEREGHDRAVIVDLGLLCLILGVLGGRALHVLADGFFMEYVHLCTDPSLVSWEITQGQCRYAEGVWDAAERVCHPAPYEDIWDRLAGCLTWAQFWKGGLAYYGGLIAAIGGGVIFLRREGFPVLKGLDLVGAVVPVGLFFGRMGCFLGGCCFGVQSDHALAVRFPAWSSASQSQWRAGELPGPHYPSLPVHPAQLYEAAGCLAIAAYLMLWARPRKRFDGQLMLLFLGLYAVLRFGLEYLRADDRGGFAGLSTSQWIGIAILAAVALAWAKLKKRQADQAA